MVRRRVWSEELADSYLALGQVDDAARVISDATRRGDADGAEMLNNELPLTEPPIRPADSRKAPALGAYTSRSSGLGISPSVRADASAAATACCRSSQPWQSQFSAIGRCTCG